MKKLKALLAVLCIVFAACAVMACGFEDSESAKTVVNAPVINSKVYNGEKQVATVEANDAYTVIENNGGVNAGEYNVVLKLTDENAYEWKTPDEADATMLTLKFVIIKATNAINDFEIDAVTCKQNIVLNATATAGTVVTYKYATAADGEYIDIPADGLVAGTYYVKAYTAGNNNYAAAESNPATLTVNHAYTWTTDANGNDYRACVCGSAERFVFDTSAEVLEKTESGYSLKLYTAEDEGKPNKVTFSFKVTLGTTVTENAVMAWTQSTEGIVEITGSDEYTVKALAIGETVLTATYTAADGKKAHVTINVTVERLTKTVEVDHETILADLATRELDLSFASDYVGENATVTYNGVILGKGALNSGKLTVDFSEMTDVGNLTFVATTDKDGVYYSFNVNVLLATKIIRTVDDLDVVKVTQTNIDNNTSIYGYYVLGNSINIKWNKTMMASFTYNGTVQNWEPNFGFRGTFDGLGHTISGFAVGTNGMFGHVGKGAVIKNVKFDNFKYNGHYNGGLFGGTVRGAEITDVTLSNVIYTKPATDPESTGFFAGRFMQDNKLTNIKIDASEYDVYSVFGRNISNNAYTDVEVKVKSFTMLGYNGDKISEETMLRELEGVTVITADTTVEA